MLDIRPKAPTDLAIRLKEKDWLERIVHGKYLILPLSAQGSSEHTVHEFVLASALVEEHGDSIAVVGRTIDGNREAIRRIVDIIIHQLRVSRGTRRA